MPWFVSLDGSLFWLAVIVGAILGYVAPSLYLDRRISRRRNEHRAGFPDFMDLLVVCADSGLSIHFEFSPIGGCSLTLSDRAGGEILNHHPLA